MAGDAHRQRDRLGAFDPDRFAVNVLRYARHLDGSRPDPGRYRRPASLQRGVRADYSLHAALAELAPALILPGHCTGWKARHALARTLPDAYVQTCVGTRICFGYVIPIP